jgi:hypothetical protein
VERLVGEDVTFEIAPGSLSLSSGVFGDRSDQTAKRRLEHRQRRPGGHALGSRIKWIGKLRDPALPDQRYEHNERRRRSVATCKAKPLLTKRTLLESP